MNTTISRGISKIIPILTVTVCLMCLCGMVVIVCSVVMRSNCALSLLCIPRGVVHA